jgi:hypothetical protein
MCFVAIVYAVLQLGINGIIIYKATKAGCLCYFVLGFTVDDFCLFRFLEAKIMRQCVLKAGKDYLFYITLLFHRY